MTGVEHILCIIRTIAGNTTRNNSSYSTDELTDLMFALQYAAADLEDEINWRHEVSEHIRPAAAASRPQGGQR